MLELCSTLTTPLSALHSRKDSSACRPRSPGPWSDRAARKPLPVLPRRHAGRALEALPAKKRVALYANLLCCIQYERDYFFKAQTPSWNKSRLDEQIYLFRRALRPPRAWSGPWDFCNIFFKLILYNYIFLLNLKDLILRREEKVLWKRGVSRTDVVIG